MSYDFVKISLAGSREIYKTSRWKSIKKGRLALALLVYSHAISHMDTCFL